MKKIFALTLAVLFVLSLCGCAAKKEESTQVSEGTLQNPISADVPSLDPVSIPGVEMDPVEDANVPSLDPVTIPGVEMDPIDKTDVPSLDPVEIPGVEMDPIGETEVPPLDPVEIPGVNMDPVPEPVSPDEPEPEPVPELEPEPEPAPEPAPSVGAMPTEGVLEVEAVGKFDPITLIDNERCTVVLTGIDPDNLWGYTLKLSLTNKTTDQTLMFSNHDCYVNGLEWEPIYAQKVAPGETTEGEMSFMGSDYEGVITEFTEILTELSVYDYDNYLNDEKILQKICVYPQGKANAVHYVHKLADTDVVLMDNDMYTVILTGIDPKGFWGYTLNTYILNKSDIKLMFSIDDCTVNGLKVSPFWAKSLEAGMGAMCDIGWFESDFTENNITEVEEIYILFNMYDYNDIFYGYSNKEQVTIHP